MLWGGGGGGEGKGGGMSLRHLLPSILHSLSDRARVPGSILVGFGLSAVLCLSPGQGL